MKKTLTEKRFGEYYEDDLSVTLRHKSGSVGGQRGSCCRVLGMVADHPTPKSTTEGISFTLNQRDYKGVIAVVLSEDYGNS